jgi:hypothetical protein
MIETHFVDFREISEIEIVIKMKLSVVKQNSLLVLVFAISYYHSTRDFSENRVDIKDILNIK